MAQMTAAGLLMVMRGGDLVERNAVEEDLHIGQRGDGDAAFAELAQRHRVIVVVAIERRHIEGAPRGPSAPAASRYLKRALVSSAVPNPANMRMVHGLPRYMVGWTPRV